MKRSYPCSLPLSAVIIALVVSLGFAAQIFAAKVQQSQRSGTELRASFQYMLSNFSGVVRSQWARIDFNPRQQEIYTLNPGSNDVRIFNRQGMEIFAFGTDGDIVSATDIASGDNGTIYILARDFARYGIQALNYRGQPEATIHIKNLPEQFRGFSPQRIEYQNRQLYLLDSGALQVIVTSANGTFKQGYDLTTELEKIAGQQDPEKKKSLGFDISGFSVDHAGNLYFTIPTLFSAFRLNKEGSLEIFGVSGSGPGKFGVVSGIIADTKGNIYVADRLRSVVLIFDQDFTFLGEFGYRGNRPQDLLVPDDLALNEVEKQVFVSQAANKGVGIYRVSLLRKR